MTLPSDPAYPIADFRKLLSDRAKIDLSPIELAEILWLAVQQSEGVEPERISSGTSESTQTEQLPIEEIEVAPQLKSEAQKEEAKLDLVLEPPKPQESAKNATKSLPIKIPEAVALRNRREISKALSPLKRKVPSRLRQAIDEEATAIRIAEDKIWSPVVKPEPERWLELAIVIEVTNVFDVWRDTLTEFQHLMQRHGAFRDVRTWQLQTSGNSQPQLFLQTSTGLNRKPRNPKELLDAGGRRLVLFLSDCTSRAWRSGEIFKLLQLWSRQNPVTIAQLLPETYWDRSALLLGSLVAMRSQLAGALSWDWILEGLSPRRRQRLRGGLRLPVVTIQPQQLGEWASAMAAVDQQQITGIVLRADAFQSDEPADSVTVPITAKQLVQRFRGTASAKARELADMMAVLPVNWSVLRLLQKNLVQKSADNLQETAALYFAEIFLSGLLCPVPMTAGQDQKSTITQQYDFVEGVRDVLLGAIPISEGREVGEEIATTIFRQLPKEVQDRVNADIERRGGESLSYFEAFLMPDLPWGEDAAAEILPFAQVTGHVLRRWGNAELAEKLEQKVVSSVRERTEDEYVPPSTVRSAIARIFDRNGEVVGTGFLVAGRSQNYILTLTDVANEALVDTTRFEFTSDVQNTVAKGLDRDEIYINFFYIAPAQKLKAKAIFYSPVLASSPEFIGFAALNVVDRLPDGVQAIQLISNLDIQNHRAHTFGFDYVEPSAWSSLGRLGYRNEDGLMKIEDFTEDFTELVSSGTPVWDENLKGVVGMAVSHSNNDVFMIPTDVLVKAWDKLNRPKERHLLSQQGNTRIYSLCTDEPWNLPFDAFVIPVGVAVSLTGSLASALRRHIGETNSLQLEAEIQRILEQKHQTKIAPEDPLIVPLSSEINSILNPVESDQEHFLICATVESPEPTIENAAKAVEAAIALSLERRLKRIVITLLGTGVNRLPVNEVAKAMLSKLDQVLSELPSSSIEEIIFVDKEENFIEIVSQVAQSLQNHKLLSFEFEIAEIIFVEEPATPKRQLESFKYQVGTVEVVESHNLLPQKKTEIRIRRQERQGEQFIERLSDKVNLEMVSIPAGQFMMGAPNKEEESRDNERPQHKVNIKAFFLGKYAITQAQYEAVMGNNPSNFSNEPDSPNHPVEKVSWNNAVNFCRLLSMQSGKEYRLPSEAEWEYACRAGTATPFHFGETLDATVANYDASFTYGQGQKGEYRGKTTPVGSFKVANAFGLYDMHGNILEWCEDTWHDNYKFAPNDNSAWVEPNKISYSLRGGSLSFNPRHCRSAYRHLSHAVVHNRIIGFRVACSA